MIATALNNPSTKATFFNSFSASMATERRAALSAFRVACMEESFPGQAENARIPEKELDLFLAGLEDSN
jgi:hypothetical protein